MKVLKNIIPNIVFANLFSVQNSTQLFLNDIYKKYNLELTNPKNYPSFLLDIPHTKINNIVHPTINTKIQNRTYDKTYELDSINEYINQEIEEEINNLTWELK